MPSALLLTKKAGLRMHHEDALRIGFPSCSDALMRQVPLLNQLRRRELELFSTLGIDLQSLDDAPLSALTGDREAVNQA